MSSPSPTPSLSWAARLFISAITLSGLAASGYSASQLLLSPPAGQWYLLTLLTLISGFLSVKFHAVGARYSVSETFVVWGTLSYGLEVGTILVLLDAAVLSGRVWYVKRKFDWTRTPFNLAAPPLSLWLSAHALFAVAGPAPLQLEANPSAFVAALGIFAVLYFLLNSTMVALAIALSQNHAPKTLVRDVFAAWWGVRDGFLNYVAGASIAALLASGGEDDRILVRILVIAPLMAVLYLTYRNSSHRVDEMQSRIDAIEKVHMATIAAFAMAIDAKDQVTHGHIRRVQQYTMEVARSLGVTDEKQLRAIEAAALLHDTGKLAVPEYILNKPGPLTPAEFEKMKEHAAVGANILKSIDFPYPVAPIVRHHHENWDGRGYPDGIKGQEIPVGARILSVVDCYDALTSDRPYRPRMTRQQAEQILLDRRGTMYDPWVVDGFMKVLDKLEAIDEAEGRNAPGLAANTGHLAGPALDVISAATAEEREFSELRRELPKAGSTQAAAEVFFRHLRRVVPAAAVVFYTQPSGESDLAALFCAGSGSSTIESTKIPVGERISGWAFAHRQIVFNSDASLDLGPVARTLPVPLRYALIAPVHDGNVSLGVIALYGSEEFQRDHRRMLESAAQLFASGVARTSVPNIGRPRAEGTSDERKVH
jgi:putative nucleotidyltransferase with HDIG domain